MKKPLCCKIDTSSVAGLLKAISDPTRLQILCLLKSKSRCVCQIQEIMGFKHNLICHHLKALKELGILRSKQEKKFTYYELDTKVYKKLLKGLNVLLGGC